MLSYDLLMFCYCKVIKSQCPLMSDKKKDNYPFTGIIIVKKIKNIMFTIVLL